MASRRPASRACASPATTVAKPVPSMSGASLSSGLAARINVVREDREKGGLEMEASSVVSQGRTVARHGWPWSRPSSRCRSHRGTRTLPRTGSRGWQHPSPRARGGSRAVAAESMCGSSSSKAPEALALLIITGSDAAEKRPRVARSLVANSGGTSPTPLPDVMRAASHAKPREGPPMRSRRVVRNLAGVRRARSDRCRRKSTAPVDR